jgi:hypothetical protein
VGTVTTTIGRVVKMPTPDNGSADLAADYLPLDGIVQIAASNATHLARVNAVRGLWESGGGEVWLDRFTDEDIRWDDSPGVLAYYCGGHLVQPYGETGLWPKLTVRAHLQASATYSVGVVLAVAASSSHPFAALLRATDSTTSTTPVEIDATVSLADLAAPLRRISASRDESGDQVEAHVWVGFYSTSNSSGSKATVHSITVHLEPP